ncbi:hypothetical protein HNQ36_005303 [Afipia massiliensis]|uniref:DUF2924 domain-containing protein n=1 Tax=Afipia massiliensis TaxID=211460 RepID=A0A840N8Z8_9BRAD|nr:DUF2924 domain-containing protein [Afipia massiliensis]MBB5055292.1 hypothetical protein [Afipia massiliensis]
MQNHISAEIEQAIDQELERLPSALIKDLRNRWKELFASDPPKVFGPDLLRRAIAQQIQERAYGGLNPSAQRELSQIIKLYNNKTGDQPELRRRIKPGAIVVREWKGTTHRVTVLSKGFYYNEQTYQSLSEVARAITGTRWNGPKFFGLRKPEPLKTASVSNKGAAKPHRDRGRSLSLSAASRPEAGHER